MSILREDKDLREALTSCRTICMVGISPDPYKPSYFVSDVLQSLSRRRLMEDINQGSTEKLNRLAGISYTLATLCISFDN